MIDQFCIVDYENRPYPGIILDVDDDQLEVQVMHSIGVNRFFWPLKVDIIWYKKDKVITLLNNEPQPVTSRHCSIEKSMWNKVVQKMML